MNVLVAFASKHGATEEIAGSIGASLIGQGLTVEIKRVEDVDTVLPYDAFVVGSAIYMGNWLREASRFIDEHAERLAQHPTWLFSSGPVPHPAAAESFDVADLLATTRAHGHQLFGGKLEKAELRLTERALISALRVPDGDYREWDLVAAWATAIARTLGSEATSLAAK